MLYIFLPETAWKSGADLVHSQHPSLCLPKPEVEWWVGGIGSRIRLVLVKAWPADVVSEPTISLLSDQSVPFPKTYCAVLGCLSRKKSTACR